MENKLKFSKLAKPTEPEFRPRISSKIFLVAIGTSAKNLLEKRLEVDVGHEIGGCLIADMKSEDLIKCYNFVRKYLPDENIVRIPLTAEGEIVAGSKDMSKVLKNRHLYSERLNNGVEKAKQVILENGITVIEILCSNGGHAIVTVEALLKIQDSAKYRKVVLVEATEKLARRNEPELITFFKKWASENEENQFFLARNPNGLVELDYAIAIAINSTYGLPSADLTDFFANLITVAGIQTKRPQSMEIHSVVGSYPLYPAWHFWLRQNARRTERALAQKLDEIQFGNNSLGIISGNIIGDFLDKQKKRLYDEFEIQPEIRQFNQIKIEKIKDCEFNFCIAKFTLLNGKASEMPTIDKLLQKMVDMP